MKSYLKPGDPGSFDGMTKKDYPSWANKEYPMVECPKCFGHGGWVGGSYLKFYCFF